MQSTPNTTTPLVPAPMAAAVQPPEPPVIPPPAAPEPAPVPVPMAGMKLLKHYRPMGEYEIVGWHKPAVIEKKNGTDVIVEPAEFVKGETAPPPMPGVGGMSPKVWAGTVIKLPVEEAKRAQKLGIAERGFED